MALKPRTGNQYVISSGEWSAVVTELGASLRELKWRGEDLIVPFDPNKVIPCCNGWVLAPYPNRVTNGQYSFDGEDYQMPIDEFDNKMNASTDVGEDFYGDSEYDMDELDRNGFEGLDDSIMDNPYDDDRY